MDKVKDLQRRVKELEAQLAHARQQRDQTTSELALYRTAIENTRDGIILIGADGKLLFCNARYRELYRHIAEHIVPGAHIHDITRANALSGHVLNIGDGADKWVDMRLAILREGIGQPCFLAFRDGTWLRASNYRTPNGDTLGIRTDVTDLKRREIQLETAHEETRNRLEAIFAHAPVAVFTKDTAGRLTAVNPTFEAWFGVSAAAVVGRTVAEALPWFPPDISETPDRQILDGGEACTIEYDLTRPDGVPINAVVTKFPVRGATGEIVAIAGVVLDMAAFKRAEQILHDTVEALPASVALYDAKGRMSWCNSFTRTLFHWQPELHKPGITYEAQIRDSVRQGLVPEAEGREEAWVENRLEQFHASATNLETARPGGKWFLSSFRKIADGGRVVIRYNISEQKHIEHALRESEANFRSLIDNSMVGMCIARGSKLLFLNHGFAALFGYELPEDLLHRDAVETLVAPHERTAIGKTARAFLRRKPLRGTAEIACVRKDGSQIWVQIATNPVVWNGASAIHATVMDVTERREADEQLRTALSDAESASRGKSDFLARMSHELRTPLNAIIGFSEVMNLETFGALGNENYRDYAADIQRSGQHLLELINDVLDMSKIEAGRYELSIEDVDLDTLIHETTHTMRGQLDRGKIALDYSLERGLGPVRADKRAMRQIMLNLLSNSIKFTPEGGKIAIHAETLPDGGIQISVADSGIGIEPEELNRILEPFGQVGTAQTAGQPGTGLGLPIVQSLAELHGGQMWIESILDKGTTVCVEIPAPLQAPEATAAG
jgi:two-component system cell cycle sensor histidine kinase PleC